MPAPACIAQAAEDYRFNSNFLLNSVKDLGPEEWFKRPSECSNHIAWILGHVIWTRKAVLARLGAEWSAPWLGLFARGVKLDETAAYPSPDTLMDAWRETGEMLSGALENCPEDVLAKPATPPSPPTVDGKISGLVRFLAWHETYHVGQIAYVRCLLGHKSLMG
jgi:uncharacterized damage-inducible protein DinB